MLISIIIPCLNEEDEANLRATLDHLAEQTGDFEIIVADGKNSSDTLPLTPDQARVVCVPGETRGVLLNRGAAMAKGEIFLFLWPGSYLSPDALLAIERNFKLMPQTIGGNFHVKFDKNSWLTRGLAYWLKRWRYRGHYYGHSGIFIRKTAYLALNGFQPSSILEDYDFARRMEQQGATLYLPEKVIVIAPSISGNDFKRLLMCLVVQFLFWIGLNPSRLLGLDRKKEKEDITTN